MVGWLVVVEPSQTRKAGFAGKNNLGVYFSFKRVACVFRTVGRCRCGSMPGGQGVGRTQKRKKKGCGETQPDPAAAGSIV